MDPAAPNATTPGEVDSVSAHAPGLLGWLNRHKVHVLASSAAVSLLVHVVILVIAALIQMHKPMAQLGSAGPEVQFAVMSDQELSKLAAEALELDAPDSTSSSAALDLQAEIELGALEAQSIDLSADAGDLSTPLGGGDLEGVGLGAGDSVGSGASFFGVEARGNRFAFVVDVSGSMSLEGRMIGMQRELIRSVQGMFTSSKFFVVFFSTGASPLGDRAGAWVDATDSNKAWARAHIMAQRPEGGTNPVPGFMLLTDLKPPPDAIYFMTDGEFPEDRADEILGMFQRRNVPIHCITFGSREGEAVMRRIAASTRGTYTHVEAPR